MATVSQPEVGVQGRKPWRVIFRVLLLLATAISLYFLFPSLVDLFTQWHALAHLNPWWLLLAVVFEATSVTALWEVQRIALRTAELVRRGDVAARRQRRGQRHP